MTKQIFGVARVMFSIYKYFTVIDSFDTVFIFLDLNLERFVPFCTRFICVYNFKNQLPYFDKQEIEGQFHVKPSNKVYESAFSHDQRTYVTTCMCLP